MDKDGSGVVTLSDLVCVYNTKFHPDVISGKLTHEQAVTQYMSQWDTVDKDGTITYEEFEEYYKVRARVADTVSHILRCCGNLGLRAHTHTHTRTHTHAHTRILYVYRGYPYCILLLTARS